MSAVLAVVGQDVAGLALGGEEHRDLAPRVDVPQEEVAIRTQEGDDAIIVLAQAMVAQQVHCRNAAPGGVIRPGPEVGRVNGSR